MLEKFRIGVVALALMAAGAADSSAHSRKSSVPQSGGEVEGKAQTDFGGPFALTDHNGQRTTDKDFRGKYLLVYFGYTSCTDVCPVDLAVIAGALDTLAAAAARVQPLFITVDPNRDTAAVLKKYVARFHPRIVGLTGSDADIKTIMESYRVQRRKLFTADSTGPDHYVMDHSAVTFLMGPDGTFRHYFLSGVSAGNLAEGIRKHMK